MIKAVVLLSGGLDSTLAARVVLDQGIELEAVNFLTIFCTCTPKKMSCLASKQAVKQLGIKLKIFNVSEEYLEIVKHPLYGYGRNLNPCIDCRILMFRKARDYMREIGASFIVTGEVLGERPMSQRKDALMRIERESGLKGLILRPLSAKLLEPTIPEKKGWVKREKLLAIKGRSRKPQMQLAQQYGIHDYPCPAGGCLLTDKGFASRMRDLIRHSPDFQLNDVKLLKIGRHFRLSPETKLIISRNETENKNLMNLAKPNDVILDARHVPGPFSILRGKINNGDIPRATSLVAAYSKQKNSKCIRLNIIMKGKKYSIACIDTLPGGRENYIHLRI